MHIYVLQRPILVAMVTRLSAAAVAISRRLRLSDSTQVTEKLMTNNGPTSHADESLLV